MTDIEREKVPPEPIVRSRGRPPLPRDENGNIIPRPAQARKPRWNPKKWHPVYEEIVLLEILGFKQYDIAAQKGISLAHVNNILCTEQAQIIKKIVAARIEKNTLQTIEHRLEKLAEKSVERMEEVLNSEEYALKAPGGMFDRAVTTLKFLGRSKDQTNAAHTTNNTLIITDNQHEVLMKGIEMAKEARRINLLPANV